MNIQKSSLYLQKPNINNKINISDNTKNEINKNQSLPIFSYYPLASDINFCALKKMQFSGMDLACVEKFKAPIEKFNVNEDLQEWAKKGIKNEFKDMTGRQPMTKVQRDAILKDWKTGLLEDKKQPSTIYLVLKSITKGVKPENDKLPSVYNKEIFDKTLNIINKKLEIEKGNQKIYSFDFNKQYNSNLKKYYLENFAPNEKGQAWVKIPSKINNPEDFNKNVNKLKILSYKTWCTNSFEAERYLACGDFHVLLEHGEPKIGIRYRDDEIVEIQGKKNNGKIPFEDLPDIKKYIKDNGLKCSKTIMNKFKDAEDLEKTKIKINKDIGEAIKNNDAKIILNYFGMKVKRPTVLERAKQILNPKRESLLTVESYHSPIKNCSFEELGINEKNVFSQIGMIKGDANFKLSNIDNLKQLKRIGGDANFEYSQIEKLGALKTIGGNANFVKSQIRNIGQLEEIGGNADFRHSKIKHLRHLKYIGGDTNFIYSKVEKLGRLKMIKGRAFIQNSLLDRTMFKKIQNKEIIDKN